MFTYGRKYVDLVEYTSNSAITKKVHLKKVPNSNYTSRLEFSATRLAIALARTIMALEPGNFDLVFQTISAYFNLQSIVDSGKKSLSLKSGFKTVYRDFSGTSRIGELAQAISYLFCQDILGYPLVLDYDSFLVSQGYPALAGSTPDFVISHILSQNVNLLESKGAVPINPVRGLKTVMREGLEQCEEGKNHLSLNAGGVPVSNTFVTSVWFAEANSPWLTTLNFADPKDENKKPIENPLAVVNYHYATWFMLLGYYHQAVELVSEGKLSLETPKKTITYNNESFYVFDYNYYSHFLDLLFPHWNLPLGMSYFNHYKFGISKKVWRLLQSESISFEHENLIFKPVSNDEVELFTDGTLIFYNR
jgi:hypothetical protein